MQNENEKQPSYSELLNNLNNENQELVDEVEKLKSELKTKELLIRQQVSYSEKLESEAQRLTEQIVTLKRSDELMNEKDAELKKLQSENAALKKKNKEQAELIQSQTKSIEDANQQLKDVYNGIHDFHELNKNIADSKFWLQKFTDETAKNLEKAVKKAQSTIIDSSNEALSAKSRFGYAIIVFAVTLIINSIISFVAYNSVSDSNKLIAQVKNDYGMIYNGLYNRRGFAVLNGTVFNENIMDKTDPVRYQYLKDKAAGKIKEQEPDKTWLQRLKDLFS